MADRDLTNIETVDLSTLAGAEPGALASLSALEREAIMVYEAAALHYGLGVYPNMPHTMPILRLLLRAIEELGRVERDFYRGE